MSFRHKSPNQWLDGPFHVQVIRPAKINNSTWAHTDVEIFYERLWESERGDNGQRRRRVFKPWQGWEIGRRQTKRKWGVRERGYCDSNDVIPLHAQWRTIIALPQQKNLPSHVTPCISRDLLAMECMVFVRLGCYTFTNNFNHKNQWASPLGLHNQVLSSSEEKAKSFVNFKAIKSIYIYSLTTVGAKF